MDLPASTPDRTVQWRVQPSRRGTFRQVRRLVVIALVFAAGCGSDAAAREPRPRPPPPVVMTAAVQDDVDPRLTADGRRRPDRARGVQPVRRSADGDVRDRRARRATGRQPRDAARRFRRVATGRLKIDAREGIYAVRVADDAIRAARVRDRPASRVGAEPVVAAVAGVPANCCIEGEVWPLARRGRACNAPRTCARVDFVTDCVTNSTLASPPSANAPSRRAADRRRPRGAVRRTRPPLASSTGRTDADRASPSRNNSSAPTPRSGPRP